MTRSFLPGVLICVLLAAPACSALPAGGDTGVIALQPFSQKDLGIRGLIPNGCREQAPGNYGCRSPGSGEAGEYVVVQQSVTYTLEAMTPLLLAQLGLAAMPDPVGTYRGTAFDWRMYEFESRLEGAGPEPVNLNLAIAAGRSRHYLVALVTLPPDYAANRVRYQAIFHHLLYALAPLE